LPTFPEVIPGYVDVIAHSFKAQISVQNRKNFREGEQLA
jgi:hypothetical protein